MTKKETEKFENLLKKEMEILEGELRTVGRINPQNPNDWEAVGAKMDIDRADKNEVADEIEEYENNTAILKSLEIQINAVKKALEKIKNETYGKCEKCGKEIETKRLEANPSAETCMACMSK